MTNTHSSGEQHAAELEELRARAALLDETREKLAATEARYKALLSTMPDMVFRMDRDGVFLEVIAANHLPQGMDPEELVGHHISGVRPEFAGEALAALRAVLDTGQLQTFEFKMPVHGEWQEFEARAVKNSDRDVILLVRDITEHKRADEAMRENAELYSSLFHGSGDGMFLFGNRGLLIDVNAAGVSMLGHKRNELLGSKLNDLLPADVIADFSGLARQLIRDKTIYFETQLQRKDGSLFFAEITATRIEIDNKSIIQASLRDVSDRKQIETSLHRRNMLLETLNEIASSISLTLNIGPLLNSIARLSGEALDVTSAYVSGWSEEEGRTYVTVLAEYKSPAASEAERVSDLGQRYDLLEYFGSVGEQFLAGVSYYVTHVDDLAVSLKERERLASYGAKTVLAILLKDGETPIGSIDFWESRHRREYTAGELETAIAIAKQVSIAITNAQLHEALTESERRWRSVVENVPSIVMTLDRTGIVQSVNRTITGSDPEDAIGTPMFKYAPPEYHENLKDILRRVFEKKKPVSFEQIGIRNDGRPRWYSNHISPIIRDGEVREATLIATDLTPHKRALHEINEQRLLAESLSDTAAALNSTLDTEEVLDLILDNLGKLIEYDAASILLLDESRTTARAVRSQGYGQRNLEEYIAGHTFVVADLPSMQEMIETGEPFAQAITGYETHPSMQADERMQWVKSHASAPIRVRDEVIGFLELEGAVTGKFSNETLKPLATFANQVALALENTRLFQSERDQRTLAEALRDTAAALNGSLNLDEVLDLILREVQRVVEHDAATIMLVKDGIARIANSWGYASRGFNYAIGPSQIRVEETANLLAMAETGKPIVLADTREFHDWKQEPGSTWILSYVGAPILREGKILGFINLDKEEAGGFTERDGDRLLAFANQAAIAIENANLFTSEHDQRTLAEALQSSAEALNSTLDLEEVLDHILSAVGRVVPHDAANIMLMEKGLARIARLHGYEGTDFERMAPELRLNLDEVAPFLNLAEATEPFIVDDVNEYAEWLKLAQNRTIRSFIGAPIRLEGRLLGFLDLDSSEPNFYKNVHKKRLQIFANQAAIAIANASSYASSQRRQQYFKTLHAVSRRSVPERNQREFMQAIVNGLIEEFDYALATIMLVDNERERLILGATAGVFSEAFHAITRDGFDRNKGIIGWVSRHGEPYLASDVTTDEFYFAPPKHVKMGSQISVPLKQYGEVMGVLSVETAGANTLDELDLEMLGELADELVLSLDNVRLYEEAEQHAQNLERRVEERTADLAAANEEIRSFAYIVSHDLRGPLLNLRGYAGELRTSMGVVREMMETVQAQLAEPDAKALNQTLREDVPESLQFIEQAVEKLDRLTSAILKLSRLGRRELVDEQLDMNELARTIIKINHYLLEQRNIKIDLHPLPEIYADSTAMDQIFNNILTNAILYLEPDRPGEISIGGERREDETYFFVRDNGRGIAEEDNNKVFDIFRRAGKPDVDGEGMGLSYVQALIRRYGGHIWFDSEQGVGTTFHFTIPNSHPHSQGDSRGEQ